MTDTDVSTAALELSASLKNGSKPLMNLSTDLILQMINPTLYIQVIPPSFIRYKKETR